MGGRMASEPDAKQVSVKEEVETECSAPPAYGGGPEYWDERYTKDPEPFEWLQGYEQLGPLIHELLGGRKDAEILHVGCGNSPLPEKMYDAGYLRIVNVDNSQVCIDQMKSRNRELRPELVWRNLDATCMTGIMDACFALVLDKSMLDTLACGHNASLNIKSYLHQVKRVLRPGGTYLCISYGAPRSRLEYFSDPKVSMPVEHKQIGNLDYGGPHFAYLFRKGSSQHDGSRSRSPKARANK